MRRSFVFGIFIFFITAAAGIFFFFGTDLEHGSAQFLFSKLSFLARSTLNGSPFRGAPYNVVGVSSDAKQVRSDAVNLDAAVIFRPPSIPYDQIIIDRGERDGVRIGSRVFAVPDILVGSISEVFWDSSRVVSPTSFGHEMDVVIERSGTVIPALGYGNRELRIRLPRDFDIVVGDRIVAPGSERYVIGDVLGVMGESTGAVKEARVRQRFNDWTILSVYVAP